MYHQAEMVQCNTCQILSAELSIVSQLARLCGVELKMLICSLLLWQGSPTTVFTRYTSRATIVYCVCPKYITYVLVPIQGQSNLLQLHSQAMVNYTQVYAVLCIGLGELCIKLPVLCYASNSIIIMLPEKAVLCSHYAQLCNGILPLYPRAGPSHLL